MIALPPGCTVGYEIKITVKELTDEMGNWFTLQEGRAWAIEEYDARGRRKLIKYVQFGRAKPSYHMQDGTGNVLIRFAGADATTASVFILKFYDEIINHNMEETMKRYEYEG